MYPYVEKQAQDELTPYDRPELGIHIGRGIGAGSLLGTGMGMIGGAGLARGARPLGALIGGIGGGALGAISGVPAGIVAYSKDKELFNEAVKEKYLDMMAQRKAWHEQYLANQMPKQASVPLKLNQTPFQKAQETAYNEVKRLGDRANQAGKKVYRVGKKVAIGGAIGAGILGIGVPALAAGTYLLANRDHDKRADEVYNDLMKVAYSTEEKTAGTWTRKEGQNPEGGLNQKGRDSYNRETGGNLKRPVSKEEADRSDKAAARRKSFCARMSGMKKRLTSAETARDPDSRINKALRKWDC